MTKFCKISGIANQNEMEATAKRRVRNELNLKAKLGVIRDANGKSHRQLTERYNISQSQVGNILKKKGNISMHLRTTNQPAESDKLSTRHLTRLV